MAKNPPPLDVFRLLLLSYHRRLSIILRSARTLAWKAVGLVTVGVCVVVMAMVGWMGVGMELVLGKHVGQSQVVGRMSGDAGAFPECVGNTLITPDRTTIQVRSSGVESELVRLPGKV